MRPERAGRRRETGPRAGKGAGRAATRFGLGWFFSFFSSISFPISIPFQTQLFEFKLKFEFKPYALK